VDDLGFGGATSGEKECLQSNVSALLYNADITDHCDSPSAPLAPLGASRSARPPASRCRPCSRSRRPCDMSSCGRPSGRRRRGGDAAAQEDVSDACGHECVVQVVEDSLGDLLPLA